MLSFVYHSYLHNLVLYIPIIFVDIYTTNDTKIDIKQCIEYIILIALLMDLSE